MVYKIGLLGTHGTGKTILATQVEAELGRRGVTVMRLGETASNARKHGLPINEETTFEAQLWILHRWCADRILYSVPRLGMPIYETSIEDRGIDNYCYLENKFGENKFALSMVLSQLGLFPYDQLYQLPIVSDDIQDNGLRTIEPVFQKTMQDRIIDFLGKHQIEYTQLPIPENHDHLRNIWARIIVNDTLRALGKPEKYFMRE
ncbi:TPA: hypothetical protein HA242_05375 [Candidatus Woesearchaeota archaeon]|nr:hypothetical protein [Candidatus Woesearchaeota archaeon]